MATEATSTQRIFNIRKQRFRQKISRDTQWTIDIEAHDQVGDEVHPWKMRGYFSSISSKWFVCLSGYVNGRDVKYKRCYCKVQLYSNGEKVTIHKEYIKGPTFNQFDFQCIYYLNDFVYSMDPNKVIEIIITIASCDEKTFIERHKTLLDEGILTDTIIKTKDQEFPCHKFVLASQSEYFKKMFQTDMKESQTNSVDWTGIFDAPVVKDLLHFFYTGKNPPNIVDNHFELLKAAHLCLLPDLKVMCVNSIIPNISVDNMDCVLQSALTYESKHLRRGLLRFIADHWDDVLTTNFLDNLERNDYEELFKSIFEMFRKNILVD